MATDISVGVVLQQQQAALGQFEHEFEFVDKTHIGNITFGSLYKVRRTDTNCLLALKVIRLPCEISEEGAESHRKESVRQLQWLRSLQNLRHESIVQFVHADYKPVAKYQLFMEFIDGRTLAEMLDTAALDKQKMQQYCRMICSGIEYLHSQHVVHCNINGKNVMIESNSDKVKLIDFGVSLKLAMSGSQVASAHYTNQNRSESSFMSPEMLQLPQRRFSPESDIWAFGCTVYQMCARQVPYSDTRNMMARMRKILEEGAPALPEELAEDLDLRSFYESCVQMEPHDRLTAAQLLQHPFLLRQL